MPRVKGKKHIVLTGFLLFPSVLHAQKIQIRESQLASFLTDAMPGFSATKLQEEAAELESQSFQDQFTTIFGSKTSLGESDDPRQSSQIQRQTFQIQQKLNAGLGVFGGVHIERQKLSPEPFFPPPFANQRLYSPVLMMGIEIDLWKNFLGRFDQKQQVHLQRLVEKSKLKTNLDRKSLHITLRSLFWQLASQDRRIEIYRKLVQSAERGYRDAQARQRDHVADQGMVAKLSANLSSAQAQYQAASIQKHFLEKELKTLIPSLQGRDLDIIASYHSIRQTVSQSVKCAETVGRLRSIPFDHTEYDDMIRTIQEALELEQGLLDNYDRADVKLSYQAQSFGLDEDFSESQKQAASLDKTGYEIVLSIDVPLGRQLRQSKKQQLQLSERRARIDQSNLEAQFKATHESLTHVIKHLSYAVDLFHKSITQLETSFHNTGTKFRQGRISVHEYLSDQDMLLQTQLEVLNIEERIILETLNYFRVFNQSPCELNRI
ncbi:MAG: TolC family protein [Oligoflexus sp.]